MDSRNLPHYLRTARALALASGLIPMLVGCSASGLPDGSGEQDGEGKALSAPDTGPPPEGTDNEASSAPDAGSTPADAGNDAWLFAGIGPPPEDPMAARRPRPTPVPRQPSRGRCLVLARLGPPPGGPPK